MAANESIPIIDISPYLDSASSPEVKTRVIEEVAKACSMYGFLQIKGHGVPLQAQRQILQCCRTFFNLPVEQKEALSLMNSPSRHGYERLREQTLDKRAPPDEKEGFYIGREEPIEKGFRQGPNQWPTTLAAEAFREPVTAYYTHLRRLARSVMELLVQGLGHPVSVLEAFTREPTMNLKLLHYPPTSAQDARDDATAEIAPNAETPESGDVQVSANPRKPRLGAGEHTDFGAITLLLQQPGKHGLQVWDHRADKGGKGRWIAVPAVEDVLVVNMGDLVQEWTGGAYRSTVHRVVIPDGGQGGGGDGEHRYSVPCFYEGDYRSTNPFVPPGQDGGETVEVHIRKRFDRTYGLTAAVA